MAAKRKPRNTGNPGYERYLQSPVWRAIRARVIFRDLGMCRALVDGKPCLSRKDVEVHHLTYLRFGKEQMRDLVTLCHDCHKAHHKRMGRR